MHSTELGGTGVPAFLTKLWRLVEDPKCDELICWSPNGLSFIIHDQSRFSKELLPLYFKHNNMASFIRQLNMYGFRKVMNIEQGRLRGGEKDEVEFFHQYFLKEQSNLLEFIKRKIPINRLGTVPSAATTNAREPMEEGLHVTPDALKEILGNMSGLKSKQEGVDSQLNSMKQENEALWREVAYLRQKHIKQQQIVDKLIHFLVSLVQPNRNIGVKRKLPLMLQDSSESSTSDGKVPRLSRQFSNSQNTVSLNSPEGPVIHDITDVVTDSPGQVASPLLDEGDRRTGQSPLVQMESTETPPDVSINSPLGTEEHMEPLSILDPLQTCGEPLSPSAEQPNCRTDAAQPDPSLVPISQYFSNFETNNVPDVVSEETVENDKSAPNSVLKQQPEESQMQIALSDNSSLSSFVNTFGLETSKPRTSFINDHLEGVESELAWLQEQLSNGTSFNFDTSALLGLFSSDDTVPGSNLPSDSMKLSGSEITGNELTQYVPSLLDLDLDEELSAHSPEPSTSANLDSLLQTPQPRLHNSFNSEFERSLV